jgi:hypothetical protein
MGFSIVTINAALDAIGDLLSKRSTWTNDTMSGTWRADVDIDIGDGGRLLRLTIQHEGTPWTFLFRKAPRIGGDRPVFIGGERPVQAGLPDNFV